MVKTLLENNKAWAKERVTEDPAYFDRLVGIQKPRYLWIGCADSRVPANVIVGLEPGAIFVHRNVANIVHPTDLNCLTVLQYAVEVLKVSQILVCGHYGCGGVQAAMEDINEGMLPYWLRPVRDVMDSYVAELRRLDAPSRLKRLCELNVETQVRHVAETPILQKAWANGQDVEVHGLIYDLRDGLLRKLDCSWVPPEAGAPASPSTES